MMFGLAALVGDARILSAEFQYLSLVEEGVWLRECALPMGVERGMCGFE